MASVPRSFPDRTIVCVAGGPSLTADDVDRCRGVAPVIAVNDAYRLAPWADVLYACDPQWWAWHHGVPSFAGEKYTLSTVAADRWGLGLLENTGDAGLELAPTGLRNGRNGGYQAINLAVHLGAKRIVLLGYDMQVGLHQEVHWFGNHPGHRSAPPFSNFLLYFDSLREPLREIGVEVINCSRRTALKHFPCAPLEHALSSREVAA